MKHFEQLWEEAEKVVTTKSSLTRELIIGSLKSLIEKYEQEPVTPEVNHSQVQIFGEILLMLSYLSMSDNINVFKSLQGAIDFTKIASKVS